MSAKYRRIHREEGNYPIQSMRRWVKASKSGYYAWRNRPESSTTQRREDLTAIIVKFFDESEQTHGCRRIHAELARSGVKVSLDMVRKIMAAAGPVACQPRKQAKTTVPAPDLPGRPDRLRRNFTATAPGMRRMGGITHGPTRRGSAHPAVVMDCSPGKGSSGARSPVACAPGSSPGPRPWPCGACPPIRGVRVLRSGRGARCAWAGCTGFMAGRGVLPSVGRAGSRCGSAAAESFTAVSGRELVNRGVRSARDHAIRDVTARTGSRCDHRRLHSAIDHRTPDQVDTGWRQQHKTAARDHPSTTA